MSDTPTPDGDADTAESTTTGAESAAGAAPHGPSQATPQQGSPPGGRPGWGWRPGPGWRGPLRLLLAGLVGLILGCLLGGMLVAGLAVVADHTSGYHHHHHHHHQYQRDRDDSGSGGDHRPGQPSKRGVPQPTQS